jgi:hypothetical protein
MINEKKWRREVEDFLEETKRIVYNMKDPDDFIPTALVAIDDRNSIICVMPVDKYDFYEIVVKLAFQHQTECIATILNSWIIPPEGFRDEDFDGPQTKAMDNYIGPMPSKHPNRAEALNLWAAHGNTQFGAVIQFERNPDGSVKKFNRLSMVDDEKVVIKNRLWDNALEALRSKDFKP